MKLIKGCVVLMKSSSGMVGYGNYQCISSVSEPLGEIGLYGHNEHYKIYDIAKIIEYPQPLNIFTEEEINKLLTEYFLDKLNTDDEKEKFRNSILKFVRWINRK